MTFGPPTSATAEKPLVFVVDDDEAVRNALKFALELEGLHICSCDGGVALLAHPALPKAACIVLDRRMPEMDGFAVLDSLAARRIVVPVILIVSELTEDVRRRAARAGAAHVLEKPLTGDDLSATVRDVIGKPVS